jgi:hypothetical protein
MSNKPPILQPGDIFVAEGSMGLVSAAIRAAERFWSADNEAHHGHAGIVTDISGQTLEALWTVRQGHLSRYSGQLVLIARPTATIFSGASINPVVVKMALDAIAAEHLGRIYPVWRLPLHLVPPLAKYCHLGRWLVCSELVAKYLVYIAARCEPYTGVNPDTLADEWVRWKNFDVLYQGEWP